MKQKLRKFAKDLSKFEPEAHLAYLCVGTFYYAAEGLIVMAACSCGLLIIGLAVFLEEIE